MINDKLFAKIEPFLYIGPGLLILSLVIIYPLTYSFYLSFHDWSINTFLQGVSFVGLENYSNLLRDSAFIKSLGVTIGFMTMAISVELFLGFLLALLLNQSLKGRGIIRAALLLPMMCANVVIGLTWRLLYNYEFGIFNYFLSLFKISPVEWLSNPHIALGSLALADIWNTTSFVAIMLLAGLQTLPKETYEAADIDGANRIQVLGYVTLPLLKPIILLTLLWRIIDAFRIFDVPFLLTGGGPAGSTQTISIYIYRYGFKNFMLSKASASSYLMVIILMIIAGILLRFMRREK